jgi:hypothetical protein
MFSYGVEQKSTASTFFAQRRASLGYGPGPHWRTAVSPALNYVIRFEPAEYVFVNFDLNRCVADAETLLQLVRELHQKFVSGMAARHQAMTGQSGIGRAHRPDM